MADLSEPLRQRVSKWAGMASKKKTESAGPKRSKETERAVSKYLSKVNARHLEASKADVLRVLRIFTGLAPDIDTFVYDNGDQRKLVSDLRVKK